MTLLGELPVISGQVTVSGEVAYAPQEAWHFNGSIRDNVLFGAKFEERRYKEVLYACALEPDLKLLPYGDQTLVGEKGVSLSGGQKARLTLAR